MRTNRPWHLLLVLLAAFSLLAAACGDDDEEETSETSAPEDEGGDEEPAEGAALFEFVPLDVGGPITKRNLENGDIDIAVLFSSDGAIAANDWVALEDDKNLQPVDNFIPAIRADASNPQIEAVLNAVSEALGPEDMQGMMAAVSVEGENPADVAAEFLQEKELPGDLKATGTITVGGANFNESEIAAELYAKALEDAGVSVEKKLKLGAREVYYPALQKGDIDLIPEFVGTLLTVVYEGTPTTDLDETTRAARQATEKDGVKLLEPAPADSVNTFVVTQETAEKYDLETVSDLATVEEPLRLGGPPECPQREPCLLGLKETYKLRFDA